GCTVPSRPCSAPASSPTPSPSGARPTTGAAMARPSACSSSRCCISPYCSRHCRSTGCWDERHGRRQPPPRRQRPAPPAAQQEPLHVLLPAGAGRDLLRPHHRAHGRQGLMDKNARIAWTLVAVVSGMLGLAYAAVPLYEAFCKATGFGGTPLVAQEGERP